MTESPVAYLRHELNLLPGDSVIGRVGRTGISRSE